MKEWVCYDESVLLMHRKLYVRYRYTDINIYEEKVLPLNTLFSKHFNQHTHMGTLQTAAHNISYLFSQAIPDLFFLD